MDRTITVYILLDLITLAHSERVILMNTTRDGWKLWKKNTDKYQGWRIQNLPPNADEVYGVCNVNQRTSNSWLRSPFIPRERGIILQVKLSFTMRRCKDNLDSRTYEFCEEVFHLLTYEADADTEEIQYNEKFFKNVETISSDVKWEGKDRTENILNQHESSISVRRAGVIIAFKNTGSCVMIKEVVVYYSHCNALVSNFVFFAPAATGNGASERQIEGRCVEGATKKLSNEEMLNFCQSNGRWVKEIFPQICECSPGHEGNQNRTKCPKCATNFFKSSAGSSACIPCPQTSFSPLGSSRCYCNSGYHEVPKTGVVLFCKRPPPKPRNLQINSTDEARISITWESPGSEQTSAGDTNNSLKYSITCINCPNKMQISPSAVISGYKVVIHGALPSREYNFKVSTENDVTPFLKNAFDIDQSASKISVLTNPLENIEKLVIDKAEKVDNSILVRWQKPRSTIEKVEYECVLSGYKEAVTPAEAKNSFSEEYSFTRGTQYSFKKMGAEIRHYAVKVRWRNHKGWGYFSEPKFIDLKKVPGKTANVVVTISTEKAPNMSTLAGADSMLSNSKKDVILVIVGGVLLVIVIIIVVILVSYCVRKQMVYTAYRMKIKKSNYECSNPTQMIYSSAYSLPIQQQSLKYHDPVTYSDISVALHDFTKEMNPAWISMDALVGEGQFGDVFCGSIKTPGIEDKVVAIKILKASASDKERNNFLVEASTMGQFLHENIVRLQGVVSLSEPYMIVTEYMVNGALLNFLITNKDKMSITQQLKMLGNVAAGMRYLSSMGFIHRDLAARNILLDNDLTCKIADFGLSRELTSEDSEEIYQNKNEFKIPIKWTSPEAILYNRFSHAADVWSYGVLAWEILSYGEKPYWQWSNQEVIDAIQSGYRLPPPVNCPPIIHNFMLHCWNNSADQRPTFTQLYYEVEKLISRFHSDFQIAETDFNRKEYKCCEKAHLLRQSHCDVSQDVIAPQPPPRNVVVDSRNVRVGSTPDTLGFPLTLTRQSMHCGTDNDSLMKEPIMTSPKINQINLPLASYLPSKVFYRAYTPQPTHEYLSYGIDLPDIPLHNVFNSSFNGSMMTIEEFLLGCKTPQYITLMRRSGIQTVDQLRHVKSDNLKSLGISCKEHRVNIIKALQPPTYC